MTARMARITGSWAVGALLAASWACLAFLASALFGVEVTGTGAGPATAAVVPVATAVGAAVGEPPGSTPPRGPPPSSPRYWPPLLPFVNTCSEMLGGGVVYVDEVDGL